MKFAWESTVLAALLLPFALTEAQSCSNGIAGYEASGVCCPVSCGQCGGSGCSSRGAGCCTGGIKDSGVSCSESNSAPCIIDGGSSGGDTAQQTCPGGIPGINANNAVCCPLGCGQCGGKGCSTAGKDAGLGSESCCGSGIKATQDLCSTTGTAPCVLGGEPTAPEAPDSGYSGGQYGNEYSGDGTYYGYTTQGNCAFFDNVPNMYDGMIPVALGASQYGDSLMCGACIEGTSNGNGGGSNPLPSTFKAFVSDKCPECSEGDLDFSMSGDGRWDITWNFVPCPGEDISFVSPSANPWYWKLQPRGTKTPVESLTIGGQSAHRTDDNHFVRSNSGEGWSGTQTVVMTTVAGETHTSQVTLY